MNKLALVLAATVLCVGLDVRAVTLPIVEHTVPDPHTSPGVINPNVTQDNIGETICKSGWTATVRPPTSYTNALKKQQLASWGYDDRDRKDYEEDHIVPLEVGGHPTDPGNLWPEPYGIEWGARVKDKLETFVKREVCAGRMMLVDGQALFQNDWTRAFRDLCGSGPGVKCKVGEK